MAHKYFLLRSKSDSKYEADIKNGDIVLVRQQTTAKPGDKVVVLINNEVAIEKYDILERSKSCLIQGVVVTNIKEE